MVFCQLLQVTTSLAVFVVSTREYVSHRISIQFCLGLDVLLNEDVIFSIVSLDLGLMKLCTVGMRN